MNEPPGVPPAEAAPEAEAPAAARKSDVEEPPAKKAKKAAKTEGKTTRKGKIRVVLLLPLAFWQPAWLHWGVA